MRPARNGGGSSKFCNLFVCARAFAPFQICIYDIESMNNNMNISNEKPAEHLLTESEIQVLPDFIANQIAAGEVVQRPESVVKELVENSLDAGASEIIVIVKDAGKQAIHVIDNGKGMNKKDLLLAPKRHATSKIKTSEDLARITTLGFRGEALASICSVARVEIRSRKSGMEHGWKLLSEPLQEPVLEPIAMEIGTHIFVRNLFYNVPARRKFLRSDLTEFRHIADSMTRFALAKPDVRFIFYEDDALVYDLPPATPFERVKAALGERFADTLMRVDYSERLAAGADLHIYGFIGQAQFAKKTKADQYLYLNGRTIASRQLSHAVMSGYEHLLGQAAYPPFILFLSVDPERVDVNIHPQKHEVKFDDDRTMYSAVRRAVAQTLDRHNLAPGAQFRETQTSAFGDAQSGGEKMTLSPSHLSARRSGGMLVDKTMGEILQDWSPRDQETPMRRRDEDEQLYPRFPERRISQKEQSAYEQLFGAESRSGGFSPTSSSSTLPSSAFSSSSHSTNSPAASERGDASAETREEERRQTKFFWQLHRKYIVTPTERGMAIIDQHAAHERILYERALKAMNEGFAYGQELLFPVEMRAASGEMALVRELLEDLRGMGFHLRLHEGEKVEICGVPADVRTGREEDALRELLEQYREYNELRHTDARDNLAASFACRSAIRAGDALSFQEMRQLVEDLYAADMPFACPHGRPTVIEIPLGEFDKRFGRSS
jgi:DNA mismatch repair protein MutL